jgi:transcriptional regulator with XRE-family HTH domain
MNTTEIEERANKLGLPVRELLKRAGVNRATWWRWKKGRYSPRQATAERIERALNHIITK